MGNEYQLAHFGDDEVDKTEKSGADTHAFVDTSSHTGNNAAGTDSEVTKVSQVRLDCKGVSPAVLHENDSQGQLERRSTVNAIFKEEKISIPPGSSFKLELDEVAEK